jgi:acyl-CoA ligase (AMP-forming) (exosortase A-associated)
LPPYVPPSLPIDHLLLRGVNSARALITRDRTFGFAELNDFVGRLARVLLEQGLEPGDRVATWLPKTVIACIMPLAAARAGLIHVPINPALKAAQVSHILNDSGAQLIVTAPARAALLPVTEIAILNEGDAMAALARGVALPASSASPDDLAAILYTSGSTGRPKGVMLSHTNLWLGAISVSGYLGIAPDDVTLALLPLSFDYGQNQLLNSWAAGAAVVPLDFLTPRDVIKAIDRHDVTTLPGVPPLWVQLVEADWPAGVGEKVKRLTNTGGALTPGLIDRMRVTFPKADVIPMYGLTEAFRSTYLDSALVAKHPTSMGKAIPHAEIMVIRPDGSETDVDEPGELVHAGPLVAQGYWQDAERTASRFKPAPAISTFGGTAVWSGDTVKRDANGLFYFVGRYDEMIKVSGNRVSPTEVEEAAAKSGLIAECVAVGIPDERLGQSITLIARALQGAASDALLPYLKQELPAFMVPKSIIWRPEMPRNANGKLDRATLKAEALA